jgi:hypothetical protein
MHRCNWFRALWIRTLKIDILTLFISLTIFTFTCVISYSYLKNSHAIMRYSKGAMARNSLSIIEHVTHIKDNAELVLENTSGLFIDSKIISVDDPQLQLFMLNVLKFNPEISSFFLALTTGERILVKNINASTQTHFISKPSIPLPINASHIIKVINLKNLKFPEIWYYTDANFKTIATEEFPNITILIKTRPWYEGAIQTKKIFWTDVYYYIHTNEPGFNS